MLLLEQRPGPMDVVGIQPVVVDAQGVFQVVHSVMPPTWNKNGVPRLLQQQQISYHCHAARQRICAGHGKGWRQGKARHNSMGRAMWKGQDKVGSGVRVGYS